METPRRLFALVRGLPPDAALRLYQEPKTLAERVKQKFSGANVLSVDEFAARNQLRLKGGK